MPSSDCCLPAVSCVSPLRPAAEFRPLGAEECFCADDAGLAQGHGIFRVNSLDLPVEYTDGVRAPLPWEDGLRLLDPETSFPIIVLVVVVVAMAGRREGLEALGSLLVAAGLSAAIFPLGATAAGVIGIFTLSPGAAYGFGGLLVLGGLALSFVTGVLTLVQRVRSGASRPAWTFGLPALGLGLVVGVVAVWNWSPVAARRSLELAPPTVRAPAGSPRASQGVP